MLSRILEPEVMDSPEEASDYDAIDHSVVNRQFVDDFLSFWDGRSPVLDVGTGTAQIPIELCRRRPDARVVGVDLAGHMLSVARRSAHVHGFADRLTLELQDAKRLSYPSASFPALISNSIIHHIPEPGSVLREIVRVLMPGGSLLVRDLLRPPDEVTFLRLVSMYSGAANADQRKMFGDSLRAALTLQEVRAMVMALGFAPASVLQTSDRHWTWTARPLGHGKTKRSGATSC
jgi:ubiquinone/menaquinone biosynthesis C-methylase UbiE